MTGPLDIAEISGMLAGRMLALAAELLPGGRREGAEWRCGSVAGEPGRSMAVRLSGPKAGVWCDWAGAPGDRGDPVDLVAKVLFGGDKGKAIRWARAWLGIDRLDPRSIAQQRRQAVVKEKRAQASEAWVRGKAMQIFIEAKPLPGTPAEAYLQGRAIDWRRLGRYPGALRFHPGLPDPETGEFHPTLLAAITGSDGRICAVHRTFLEASGDGTVAKASGLEDPKATLGTYAHLGGSIRLWRGSSGLPLHRAPPAEWIIIGEGIEDVGTAVIAAPEHRALVAVSGGHIANVWLPEGAAGVILLAQNEDNARAVAAFEATVKGLLARKLGVRIARPPADVKDLNDLARRIG